MVDQYPSGPEQSQEEAEDFSFIDGYIRQHNDWFRLVAVLHDRCHQMVFISSPDEFQRLEGIELLANYGNRLGSINFNPTQIIYSFPEISPNDFAYFWQSVKLSLQHPEADNKIHDGYSWNVLARDELIKLSSQHSSVLEALLAGQMPSTY